MALFGELAAEFGVVFHDAVVGDHHVAGAVRVRVGVLVGWRAVRGPAGVAYAGLALGKGLTDVRAEVGELARQLAHPRTSPTESCRAMPALS